MKVMVFVKATEESERGDMPSLELITAMGKFNDELTAAGIMENGDGLKPTSAGARVHFDGANRVVTDGPFTETKELVAGFWIWNVRDLAHAIEWVKKCPNPMTGPSDIEIRPFYTAEDFAELVSQAEAAADQ